MRTNMNMRNKIEAMAAGYAGHDSMRENAERLLQPHMRGVKVTEVAMRPFKKGGHTHDSMHKYKHEEKSYHAKHGKDKHGWGGFLGSGLGALAGAGLGSLAGGVGAMPGAMYGAGLGGNIGNYLPFKKGGKVSNSKKSHHSKAHHEEHEHHSMATEHEHHGMGRGHAHHKKSHHMLGEHEHHKKAHHSMAEEHAYHKKAAGGRALGAVHYPMVGEHAINYPGDHPGHYALMRTGGKVSKKSHHSKAHHMLGEHEHHGHEHHSKAHHSMAGEHEHPTHHKIAHHNKALGAVHYPMVGEHEVRARKHGGAVRKMAVGGVAKIRHGEATASGQPIRKRGKSLSKIMSGK